MNPPCNDSDGLCSIFPEVLTGFADGYSARADEMQNEVSDGGQGSSTGTNTATILVERHIAHIMDLPPVKFPEHEDHSP